MYENLKLPFSSDKEKRYVYIDSFTIKLTDYHENKISLKKDK